MCRSVWVSAGRGGSSDAPSLAGGCPSVGACVYGGLGGERGAWDRGRFCPSRGPPARAAPAAPRPSPAGREGRGWGPRLPRVPSLPPGPPPPSSPRHRGCPRGRGGSGSARSRRRGPGCRPLPSRAPGGRPRPRARSSRAVRGGGSWRAPSPLLRPLPWLRGRRGAAGCGRLLRGGWQPPP